MKLTLTNNGAAVRVIKQVNTDDVELAPGASMVIDGPTLIEVRELGMDTYIPDNISGD